MPMSGGADGWIYAIREEGTPLVKIGATVKAVRYRHQELTSQFRVSLVIAGQVYVSGGVVLVEHRLHAILAAERIQGEWFYMHMNQATLEGLVMQARDDVDTSKRIEDERWQKRKRFGARPGA